MHTKVKKVCTQNATLQKNKCNVATKDKNISWIDIENEYVTDRRKKPCTLESLSNNYNISFSRIEKYARKNEWTLKRENYAKTVREKAIEKTLEKDSEKLADRNLRILNISDKFADVIDNYVEDKQYKKHVVKYKHYIEGKADREELVSQELDVIDTKAFSNMVSSLDKIQKGQRIAEGLDKPKKESAEQQKGNLDKLIDVFNKGPVIE